MSAIDELRDAGADTNALIPLALGLLARARPLVSALRAAAPNAATSSTSTRNEALRHAVLGYVALALRVEATIDEAARRPVREPAARPPPPFAGRELLR